MLAPAADEAKFGDGLLGGLDAWGGDFNVDVDVHEMEFGNGEGIVEDWLVGEVVDACIAVRCEAKSYLIYEILQC